MKTLNYTELMNRINKAIVDYSNEQGVETETHSYGVEVLREDPYRYLFRVIVEEKDGINEDRNIRKHLEITRRIKHGF